MHRPLEVEEIVCILNIGRLIAVSPQFALRSADNLTPGNYMRNRTLADLIVSLLSAEGMDWDAFSHHFRFGFSFNGYRHHHR